MQCEEGRGVDEQQVLLEPSLSGCGAGLWLRDERMRGFKSSRELLVEPVLSGDFLAIREDCRPPLTEDEPERLVDDTERPRRSQKRNLACATTHHNGEETYEWFVLPFYKRCNTEFGKEGKRVDEIGRAHV